ncbi:MAG: hypothetical protein EOO50_14720 [Flavobacterium sp.]|uniref:hypothetical protein n=1 Tax=Flavobacterium sp. TaxID=239 RepID=UPI00121F511B|nr:hypothetical protein [Flavobacterium sp.]RZJ65161.1 MAG: hypothetical protein EOO50_14720 [Flavobacterium sp.]
MKIRLLLCALLPFLVSSCIGFNFGEDDEPNISQSNYTAQIMDRAVFESSVQLLPPIDVEKSGKIYIMDHLMVVNDVNKGFHIYNYANPQLPTPIAFLQMPGATDVAMRGDKMYINQAVDLVTIRYNKVENTMAIESRSENVFPQKIAPDFSYTDLNPNEIIVNWTLNN